MVTWFGKFDVWGVVGELAQRRGEGATRPSTTVTVISMTSRGWRS